MTELHRRKKFVPTLFVGYAGGTQLISVINAEIE